ncbi:MAG: dTMP kinase [Anaerolineaceae bacterium]|nr:dTMP kinase [Anaerolineaceae bacterium]|tara:strand:- start:61 stop:687 length:627 start_codon:yes stop_codon:yes gene_type:complete
MFVTLEGPEGSGKTTLCVRLERMLVNKGYEVFCVREPGGTVIGQQVRDILLDQDNTSMLPETEFMLFSASRAQLVREVVVPRLESGAIVLCDRFLDSSLAYQGYGHRLDVGVLEKISSFVTSGVTADLTVLLDISPEQGLRRRQQDPETWNRLDAYAIDFHERVRKGFLCLAENNPNIWKVVDASQSEDEIFTTVSAMLLNELSKRGI